MWTQLIESNKNIVSFQYNFKKYCHKEIVDLLGVKQLLVFKIDFSIKSKTKNYVESIKLNFFEIQRTEGEQIY